MCISNGSAALRATLAAKAMYACTHYRSRWAVSAASAAATARTRPVRTGGQDLLSLYDMTPETKPTSAAYCIVRRRVTTSWLAGIVPHFRTSGSDSGPGSVYRPPVPARPHHPVLDVSHVFGTRQAPAEERAEDVDLYASHRWWKDGGPASQDWFCIGFPCISSPTLTPSIRGTLRRSGCALARSSPCTCMARIL
jgi:hypothetical protein